MRFEWDRRKALANFAKHGVTFEEAVVAFRDLFSLTISDPDHSQGEPRYLLLGQSYEGRLLVVSHTERGETVRIINARRAGRRETRLYEEGED
jgi:hypothetical protein